MVSLAREREREIVWKSKKEKKKGEKIKSAGLCHHHRIRRVQGAAIKKTKFISV
jgi:hypothetical protein